MSEEDSKQKDPQDDKTRVLKRESQDTFEQQEIFGGRYKIVEVIAHGGMGTLYHAVDTILDRDVALKILHPHYCKDEVFRQRFHREARAMARLDHPNIIRIFDFSDRQDELFLVMEYFPEGDLKQYIRKTGPLSPAEILFIGYQISNALAYAHERGILHRDIKPANILYNPQSCAKLTDFGIAAAAGDMTLTKVGDVMGTPSYMSPEQAAGADMDPRSDIFSLGIVLYELLTGKLPYGNTSQVAVTAKLIYEKEEISLDYPEDAPEELKALLDKMVRRKPENRIPDAATLAAEFQNTAIALGISLGTEGSGIPIPQLQTNRKRPNPVTIIASGVGALIIGIVILVLILQSGDEAPETPSRVAATEAVPPALEPRQETITAEKLTRGELARRPEITEEEQRTRKILKIIDERSQSIENLYAKLENARTSAVNAGVLNLLPKQEIDDVYAMERESDEMIGKIDLLLAENDYDGVISTLVEAENNLKQTIDAWLSLEFQARKKKAEIQRQKELEQKKAQQHKLQAETEESEQKSSQHTPPTTNKRLTNKDVSDVSQKLIGIKYAFEDKDLSRLTALSMIPDSEISFLKSIFANYESVEATLRDVDITKDKAEAILEITSLRRPDGSIAKPSPAWKHKRILVNRKNSKWQTPVWK